MGVQYYSNKPSGVRCYHMPYATCVIDPDGGAALIEPGEWPTEEECAANEGKEFFFGINEWIPQDDCAGGIYIPEDAYDARIAELDAKDRREHPERYEGEEDGEE